MAEELNPIEYERILNQLRNKHSPELLRLVELNVLGMQLCHALGHDMHLMVAEAVRCYCLVHNFSLDQLTAAAKDMDDAYLTIGVQQIKQAVAQPFAEATCAELLSRMKTPPPAA